MRKLTFDTLPGAIAEILERLDRVEQLLNGKIPSKAKVKSSVTKSTGESVDIKDAAKMLSVSVASLYSYVKNKRIPFEKAGRKLVFSRTALEAWKLEKDNSKKDTSKKETGKKETSKKVTGKKVTGKKVTSKKVTGKKDTSKKDISIKDVNINPNESITAQEAQKIFNKPLPSIYYLIKTRKLQVVEKKGRTLYYSKDELSNALKGKQKKSDKSPS
jgi:excisionase family DNA binding protein